MKPYQVVSLVLLVTMRTRAGPLRVDEVTTAVPGVAARTGLPHFALISVPGWRPEVCRSCALAAITGNMTFGAVEGRSSGGSCAPAGAVPSRRVPTTVQARTPVSAPARRFEIVTRRSMAQNGRKMVLV